MQLPRFCIPRPGRTMWTLQNMRHKLRHATQNKDPENNGEHHSPKRVPLRWLPWLRLKQNDREEVSLEPKCLRRWWGWGVEGRERGRRGRGRWWWWWWCGRCAYMTCLSKPHSRMHLIRVTPGVPATPDPALMAGVALTLYLCARPPPLQRKRLDGSKK